MNVSTREAVTNAIGELTLERSDTVLWSLSPGGIVLHNFARRCFLELDDVGYRTWAYLDGARPVDEVVRRVCEESSSADVGERQLGEKVNGIIGTLLEHGFVAERRT